MDVAEVIRRRDAVIKRWCAEHGKDEARLTMDEVLAIRALPEWKNAADARSGGHDASTD